MATMMDVARKAGVSKSTVSRVLNGSTLISAPVVEAVYKAVREIGYRTNLLAQQLAAKKTQLIGFVVTNSLYNGPYFSAMIYEAGKFSEQHGYRIILADGKHSAEDERNAIEFLQDMKCAGIMVYPHQLGSEDLAALIQYSATPIVCINRSIPDFEQHTVVPDHYQAALKVMDFIVQQGHRRIAFIRGPETSPTAQQRFQAYHDKLPEYNIAFEQELVVMGDWSSQSGYTATTELISRKAGMTVILAGNDDMAMGAINALLDHGLTIPNDVAVVGFDDVPMAAMIRPNLTTMRVPLSGMIEQAILKLLGKDEEAQAVSLQSELIVRDTFIKRQQKSF